MAMAVALGHPDEALDLVLGEVLAIAPISLLLRRRSMTVSNSESGVTSRRLVFE
jgi:hypothetical protein